jgi:hypothetical protein
MPEILAFCGLAVVYVSLSLLSPDSKNPRYHSARQIRQIARSAVRVARSVHFGELLRQAAAIDRLKHPIAFLKSVVKFHAASKPCSCEMYT